MKKFLIAALFVASLLGSSADARGKRTITYEVSFTNITHGIIFTPPIFSLSRYKINVFRLGDPASPGLQMVAEGGATSELLVELENEGVQNAIQTMQPVPPGATITVLLEGNKRSRLNLASMLLPTNDGFVALNGPKVYKKRGVKVFYLKPYDAGSEENDELCDNIPGPQCRGEGFNIEDGEGFVVPHPGIHGEAELSRQAFGWGNPVAIVTVRVVNRHNNNDDEHEDVHDE